MRARWATFAIGFWLMVAPLVLGHREAAAVLHDVALGLLVCVGALAAIEWPHARFALAVPGAWLLVAGRALGWGAAPASTNELAAGAAVLLLALVPHGRPADAREPAKMAA
jgi:SPW repeat